jgi:hypothetical protein
MRTEIVRCDECAEVIPHEGRAVVIMLAEATIFGGAPTRAPFPRPEISVEQPIELCMTCAEKPILVLPYIAAARKRYAEREATMRRLAQERDFGEGLP